MFSFIKFSRPALLALALPALLAACGGGGGGGDTPGAVPVVTAQPDAVSAERNQVKGFAVLANDTATNGGKPQLVSVTTPAHGTATINGDTITYTPAAGYYGKDSFNYTANAGGASASVSALVSVDVLAPVTVSGRVVDAPAGAKATILVGTTSFDAPLDAQGNFATKVQLDAPASMVSILAQGTGTMAHVKLASLLGDSQTVLDAAAATQSVSPANLMGTHVSAFSTALYALLTKYNNDAVPATQLALDTAAGKFGTIELTQRAALIRALSGIANAAAQLAMPGTAVDTLALVSNHQAFQQFYLQTLSSHPELLYSMVLTQGEDTRLSSAPLITVDGPKSLTFYQNDTGSSPLATEMVLNSDGTGSYLKAGQRVAGTWNKSGSLNMSLPTPAVWTTTLSSPSTSPYLVQYRISEVSVRQFAGGKEHGFVVITETGVRHFPDGEYPDQPAVLTTVHRFSEWNRLGGPSDIAGVTIGGVMNPYLVQGDSAAQQMIMTFAADGSATSPQVASAVMSWKQEGNKLVVTSDNGLKQTIARLRSNGDGTEVWMARLGTDSVYTVSELFVVRVQAGLSMTATSVVNRWTKEYSAWGIDLYPFSILVNADFSAIEYSGASAGRTSTWTIDAGSLIMSTYRFGELRYQRKWTLLRDDAKAIVLLDQLSLIFGPAPEDTSHHYRIVRYNRP